MKALIPSLARFVPPIWLTLALAAAVGAALLAAFVDTLQQNVRQGEELRQWQRVGAVRHGISTVANTEQLSQAPQLGTSISPSFQQ